MGRVLPRHLRDSLLEEVSLPVLILHPLFNYLSTKSYDEMARLCHKAIKEGKVVHGEEIFQTNSSPDRMFFLTSGRLKYSMDSATGDTEDVKEEARISEATLWLKWEYRGRLNCEDQSAHFLTLDAPLFRKVMCRSSLSEVAMVYARIFFQLLVDTYEHEDEASDLFGNDPGQLDGIVKTVKGVQDGAAKFSTMGLQRGPDLEEAFDAWKEMWVQAKKKKGSRWPFWDWIVPSFYGGSKPQVSTRASETSKVEAAAPEVKIINTEAPANQS